MIFAFYLKCGLFGVDSIISFIFVPNRYMIYYLKSRVKATIIIFGLAAITTEQ